MPTQEIKRLAVSPTSTPKITSLSVISTAIHLIDLAKEVGDTEVFCPKRDLRCNKTLRKLILVIWFPGKEGRETISSHSFPSPLLWAVSPSENPEIVFLLDQRYSPNLGCQTRGWGVRSEGGGMGEQYWSFQGKGRCPLFFFFKLLPCSFSENPSLFICLQEWASLFRHCLMDKAVARGSKKLPPCLLPPCASQLSTGALCEDQLPTLHMSQSHL